MICFRRCEPAPTGFSCGRPQPNGCRSRCAASFEGQAALPRGLTARLIDEFRARTADRHQRVTVAGVSVELTAREFQVMECLRRDEPTAKIARDLGISDITVRRHISTMVRKLDLPNRRAVVHQLQADSLRVA